MQDFKVISVEGNIDVGKSTLLPTYAKQYNTPLLTVEYSRFMPVQKIAAELLKNLSSNTLGNQQRKVA
jgi:deoxyadenosine/deoxycytidine kinase